MARKRRRTSSQRLRRHVNSGQDETDVGRTFNDPDTIRHAQASVGTVTKTAWLRRLTWKLPTGTDRARCHSPPGLEQGSVRQTRSPAITTTLGRGRTKVPSAQTVPSVTADVHVSGTIRHGRVTLIALSAKRAARRVSSSKDTATAPARCPGNKKKNDDRGAGV